MQRTVRCSIRFVGMPLAVMLMVLASGCGAVAEGRMSLNGTWEACAGTAGDDYASVTAGKGRWQPVTVPARVWPTDELNQAPAVWARRTFTIPATRQGEDAVLHWGRVRWGARAWVNGVAVGESPVTCPHDIMLPAGLVHPGANTVVLRVGGWTGVPKRGGVPLIPAGYPNFHRQHPGGLFGDVWLGFYRGAYLSHVLMMPDVAASKVRVRAFVAGVRPLVGQATLSAVVRQWQPGNAAGPVLGSATMVADLAQAPGPFELAIPLQNVKLWSPQSPNLCLAQISLSLGGQVCDARQVRFGQRQLRLVDGHFELNGQRFFIRGENLMWEWFWSDAWYADTAKIRHYLVDFERGMNSEGFRTHTSPPPENWLNLADQNGMIFLSEFPMTLNGGHWPFSAADWQVYERNAVLEAKGWVWEQWNHPSVLIWVPTNEFNAQAQWQNSVLYQTIKALDPTRPVMRAAQATPDIVDTHSYAGMWYGTEGDFVNSMTHRARTKDPRRPLGCSEYCGGWGRAQQLRLNGRLGADRQALLVYSQLVSEETEALRRLQYDLILPYGTSGRADEANMTSPNYQALRSALAPVGVSLDLPNRNFATGAQASVELYLINDTPNLQSVTVHCYLTTTNPEFLLKTDFAAHPLYSRTLTEQLPANSVRRQVVGWPVPAREGEYFLSAVLTAGKQAPVISQRLLHAITPSTPPPALKHGLTLVLGADRELRSWLKRLGLPFTEPGAISPETPERVLVWDVTRVTPAQRADAAKWLQLVERGGRLVITANGKWDWPQLADFTIGKGRSSRVFWSQGVTLPPGLEGDYLRRWNGSAGAVALASLQGPLVQRGRVLMWVERPGTPVLVEATRGAGSLVVSQLDFRGRLDPARSTYDPVAERMLLYLLSG